MSDPDSRNKQSPGHTVTHSQWIAKNISKVEVINKFRKKTPIFLIFLNFHNYFIQNGGKWIISVRKIIKKRKKKKIQQHADFNTKKMKNANRPISVNCD